MTDLTQYTPDKYRLLKLDNRDGSVEHYYHFILGYLGPILLRDPKKMPPLNYLVRSCGPMDKLTAEFNFTDITVIPKQDWIGVVGLRNVPGRKLMGFDHPDYYEAAALQRLGRTVLDRFGVTAAAEPDLTLIIGRGESPEYYQSEAAENPFSGKLRRSVPNLPAIAAAIGAVRANVRLLELEGSTLREQVALFARAKCVIAQHGAALTNILWMPPGGHVVEFINAEIAVRGEYNRHFADLARAMGQSYRAVPQAHRHAEIDPQLVIEALAAG